MEKQTKQKKARIFKNTVFIIFFIVGFVTVLQLKSGKDSNVFFSREGLRNLELQLLMETSEIERLEEYLRRKNKELAEVSAMENNQNIFDILSGQRRYAMSANGYTGFKGPGIKIIVQDSDVEILPTQNPNDFVVHDQDVLNIINDLKIAEAEAISINNQIVMADSSIKCSGATITINDKTYGQPFVIRAIGNPQQLEAAVKSKDSYAFIISSLYGIRITAQQKDSIEIAGYKTNKNNIYLREATD